MTTELVNDRLRDLAENEPDAMLLPGLTNARAWAQSGAVASWLIAQGFGPGSRQFVVPAGDSSQRAVVLIGALRAGAVVVEGPAEVELDVLVNCSIDASVAERRLHIDAATPARLKDGKCLRHGDFATIAEILAG